MVRIKARVCSSFFLIAPALLIGALVWLLPANTPKSPETARPNCQLSLSSVQVPLYFVENQGQAEAQVMLYAPGRGYSLYFTTTDIVTVLPQAQRPPGRGQPGATEPSRRKTAGLAAGQMAANPPAIVRLTPVGMNRRVAVTGEEPQPARFNYFRGREDTKWRSNIPTYRTVRYRDAYPGIDLKFYGAGDHLEYDIIVKPGADPGRVKFQFTGIEELKVTPEGDLALKLPDGRVLLQKKPVVYQEIAGQRVAREGKFRVEGGAARFVYAFEVAGYDRRHPLVIDPVLVYSTYLGGSYYDGAYAVATDQAGQVYVAGFTNSSDFPVTPGSFRSSKSGDYDVFVAKLRADGSALVYATFLGGSAYEVAFGIAVDSFGQAYVTGQTMSPDFPVKNSFQAIKAGGSDVFVVKLSADGSALQYSTFLGGSGSDQGYAIAVDQSGQAYVTGETSSSDFPTKNPLQPVKGTGYDAFVAKLSADGSALVYATFLGGDSSEWGNGIAVNAAGEAYVTGLTGSLNFPTKNALQPAKAGSYDAFVTKIASDGSALLYSTFLGGTGYDEAWAIAVDQAGSAYLAGQTSSSDFPTAFPLQNSYNGAIDAFVTKLSPDGSALVYSTFLGGTSYDYAFGIAVDQLGQAYVAGMTDSLNFPTKDAWQDAKAGAYDAFVAKFNAAGSALVYSSYLGGASNDYAYAINVDKNGQAYVAGITYSANFPIRGLLQPVLRGNSDAFVVKIQDNHAPEAKAGPDLIIFSEQRSSTIIPGAATDVDNDLLTYRWLEGTTELSGWRPVGPNGEAPLDLSQINLAIGVHTLILEVSDGKSTSSDEMILTIDNSAPHVAASGAGTYEIGAAVTLGGTVADFDGDTLTYTWKEGATQLLAGTITANAGGAPLSLEPFILSGLSLDTHTLTLEVSDGVNAPVHQDVLVTIKDTQAPTLAPVVNQGILWPPNGEMVDIAIEARARDNSGGTISLTATVACNEPVEGLTAGGQSLDWSAPRVDQTTGIIYLQLRAKRPGKGQDRVYLVTITATDASGNTSSSEVRVIVPHDLGKR